MRRRVAIGVALAAALAGCSTSTTPGTPAGTSPFCAKVAAVFQSYAEVFEEALGGLLDLSNFDPFNPSSIAPKPEVVQRVKAAHDKLLADATELARLAPAGAKADAEAFRDTLKAYIEPIAAVNWDITKLSEATVTALEKAGNEATEAGDRFGQTVERECGSLPDASASFTITPEP